MTVRVHERQTMEYLGPEVITPNNVMYWCSRGEHLAGSVKRKARLYLEHECIKYVGDDSHLNAKGVFICLPLNEFEEVVVDGRSFRKIAATPYNNTVYWLRRVGADLWQCSCQGWHSKQKKGEVCEGVAGCCHVLALYYAFKCKCFGGNT